MHHFTSHIVCLFSLPLILALLTLPATAWTDETSVTWTDSQGHAWTAQVTDCRQEGSYCAPEDCVPFAEIDCAAQPECGSHGQCTALQRRGPIHYGEYVCRTWDVCGAADDSDCAGSRACTDQGQCHEGQSFYYYRCHSEDDPCYEVQTNVCNVTPESCQASTQCETLGRCGTFATMMGSRCDPTDDSHCAASAACRETGACAVVSISPNYCAPTQDDHCAQSADCQRSGRCTMERRSDWSLPICVASEESHCAESEFCSLLGHCTLDGGRCVRGE